MHLVGGDGHAARVLAGARLHPFRVGPGEVVGADHHRGGRRAKLGAEAVRVGLQGLVVPVRPADAVFVGRAFAEAREEDLPQPAVDALAHLMPAAIPGVEVADHGNRLRVRGPESEMHAVEALVAQQVRAQPLVQPPMRALDQQVVVHRARARGRRRTGPPPPSLPPNSPPATRSRGPAEGRAGSPRRSRPIAPRSGSAPAGWPAIRRAPPPATGRAAEPGACGAVQARRTGRRAGLATAPRYPPWWRVGVSCCPSPQTDI